MADKFDFLKNLLDLTNPESTANLKSLTTLMIIAESILFGLIFIVPLNLLEGVGALVSPLFEYGIPSAIFIIIYFALRTFIFSSDELYYGLPDKNPYAKAFQLYWPSKYLEKKFSLSEDDAKYYWFEKYFNTWRNPDDPRHEQWERTFSRGYACRFVYYMLRTSVILFWISFGISLLQFGLVNYIKLAQFDSHLGIGWRIAFIFGTICLYVLIRSSNRISPNRLTGVWRNFAEINKLHIRWIDENIKSINQLKKLDSRLIQQKTKSIST